MKSSYLSATAIAIYLLSLTFAFSGCANFKAGVEKAQEILCGWTPGEQTEAANVVAALEAASGVQFPDQVEVAIGKGLLYAGFVKAGLCLASTQLKEMIATYDYITELMKGIKVTAYRAKMDGIPQLRARLK